MNYRNIHTYIVIFICILLLSYTFAGAIESEEQWLGIYSGDKRIGNSYVSIRKNADGSTEVTEKTRLKVNLLDKINDVSTEANYKLNGDIIQSFDFRLKSESGDMSTRGVNKDGVLEVEIKSISGTSTLKIQEADDFVLSSLFPRWLAGKGLEPGKEYTVSLFDPLNVLIGVDRGKYVSEHVIQNTETINLPSGENVNTYRVKSAYQGNEYTTWIDSEGRIVKQTIPPGLVAYRETGEDANKSKYQAYDIAGKTFIPSSVKLTNARELTNLKARITGTGIDGFNISDGYRQLSNGTVVEIKSADLSGISAYLLPYDGGMDGKYTEPTLLIQSQDPEIISETDKILSGEADSLKAAEKINKWIFKNLKKEGTASIPNAKDVLRTKTGDCNEHATLFAAMSRASGMPTKIALGVIYMDGKFYYHAWNEVFVGQWIAVDSAFGQLPADATHIKFIEGDLTDSSHIMNLVGNINIEILDAY